GSCSPPSTRPAFCPAGTAGSVMTANFCWSSSADGAVGAAAVVSADASADAEDGAVSASTESDWPELVHALRAMAAHAGRAPAAATRRRDRVIMTASTIRERACICVWRLHTVE